MAERRRQAYPLTADLAGVLAAAEMQRPSEQNGANLRFDGAVARWAGWVLSRLTARRPTVDSYEVLDGIGAHDEAPLAQVSSRINS